jgi:hypothetical protein
MNSRPARRIAAIALTFLAVGAVLAGCTGSPRVVKNSAITVGVSDPLTSLNAQSAFGATTTNQEVAYATSSQFVYYDNTGTLHSSAR